MTYCGLNCCEKCSRFSECGRCEKCAGHPFGGSCIAERNRNFPELKRQLIEEINELHIEGMPRVEKLNALVGKYVNLEYRLPSGVNMKFLDDQTTYLGTQLESEIVDGLCFGVLANMEFIMVCTYEKEGANPELLLYKKR